MNLITLFIIYTSVTLNKAQILQTSQNYQLLPKCIHQIDIDYFSNSDVIINLNENANLDDDVIIRSISKPIIQTNLKRASRSFGFLRADAYIITTHKSLLSQIFEFLPKASHWNPRAKFLIILDEHDDDVFTQLRQIYVFNVILLIANDGEVEVFTYFPYGEKENRTKEVLIDIFDSSGFRKKVNLFPNKLPTTWENESVRLGVIPYAPYVNHPDVTNCAKFCGVELDVIALVAKKLKFTIEYVTNSYSDWGHKNEHGEYVNGSSGIQNKEFDAGLGAYFPNSTESWDFDLTYPYLEDTQNWVVPIAKLAPSRNRFLFAFRPNVWLFITLSFVVTSIAFYAIGSRVRIQERHTYRDVSRSALLTYQCFLGQATHRQPKTYPIKIIFISWVAICYILGTVIQSKAIVNFNFATYEEQIETIEQVTSSELKIGFYADSAFQFSDPTNPIDRYIYKNFYSCPRDSSCTARVALQRDFVTLKLKRHLEFLRSSRFKDARGEPMIYILNYPSRFVLISIAFAKGFPIFEDINELLFQFKSAGIVANIYNQMNTARDVNANKNRQLRTINSLGIDVFVITTYLLLIGWVSGFLAFLFENRRKIESLLIKLKLKSSSRPK